MKFSVVAVSLNTHSGDPMAPPREEIIDTATNSIFAGLTSRENVEDRYELFWNRLNGFTNNFPHGKVKVLTVEVSA